MQRTMLTSGLAAALAATLLSAAARDVELLGTVRIPQAVIAGGNLLPPGT
jgi:hypothetical protein